MQEVQNFLNLEIEFIENLKKGFNTVDLIIDNTNLSMSSVKMVIEKLQAKGVIEFNKTKRVYEFSKPIDKDNVIILDGNILLPVTIIKKEGFTYISRGHWYKFQGDIDIRNIIWNVELPTKGNNIELVELVKNSILKVKKSKIVQVPEYAQLQNIIIPWSEQVTFKIVTVGDEQTEVIVMFNFHMGNDSLVKIVWRDLTVRTLISTDQLIAELTKEVDERKFNNIELNRIYNITDFIFAGNKFPTKYSKDQIKYLEITGVRGKFELTEYVSNGTSHQKTGEVHSFADIGEGLDFMRQIFNTSVLPLIENMDFTIDDDEKK